MFKSVLAKYVGAVMMIILVSFIIITVTVTSIVNGYSTDAKAEIMENASSSSAKYIEKQMGDDELSSYLDGSIENNVNVLALASSTADDLTLLVTDSSGDILLSVGSDIELINTGEIIPEAIMAEIRGGNEISGNRQLHDVFASPRYIHATPIYGNDGEVCGAVFACAETVSLKSLLSVIIRTCIIATVWVLIAAMIAVYIITDRIVSPLKEISRAAKSFAAGKFDVRVPVKGRDEIAELAVAFNNMAESLNNYDAMRNTFMSNVSHDLRSPMTSIAGFIDGILDGVIPAEKHEYYLQIASDEVKRLSRLVATLLDISRIQAGERKFTQAPFDICEMGRQIVISFEHKINEKHLEVDFDIDDESMTVTADRDAIYQVFYNLCDNAVKFAVEGGRLRVSIKKLKNRKVLVSVFNDGQGISENDLPYVFDRFYKSDKSRGLNKTGVGLGLFISKTIVEAHGEQLWVESEYSKNCCFNFTLTQETK